MFCKFSLLQLEQLSLKQRVFGSVTKICESIHERFES